MRDEQVLLCLFSFYLHRELKFWFNHLTPILAPKNQAVHLLSRPRSARLRSEHFYAFLESILTRMATSGASNTSRTLTAP